MCHKYIVQNEGMTPEYSQAVVQMGRRAPRLERGDGPITRPRLLCYVIVTHKPVSFLLASLPVVSNLGQAYS
jgi:hypothetical protein